MLSRLSRRKRYAEEDPLAGILDAKESPQPQELPVTEEFNWKREFDLLKGGFPTSEKSPTEKGKYQIWYKQTPHQIQAGAKTLDGKEVFRYDSSKNPRLKASKELSQDEFFKDLAKDLKEDSNKLLPSKTQSPREIKLFK